MTGFSLDEFVINVLSDIRITDFLRHKIFKSFESWFGISISISDGHGFWIHAESSPNSWFWCDRFTSSQASFESLGDLQHISWKDFVSIAVPALKFWVRISTRASYNLVEVFNAFRSLFNDFSNFRRESIHHISAIDESGRLLKKLTLIITYHELRWIPTFIVNFHVFKSSGAWIFQREIVFCPRAFRITAAFFSEKARGIEWRTVMGWIFLKF